MIHVRNITWLDPAELTVTRGDLLIEPGPAGGMTLLPEDDNAAGPAEAPGLMDACPPPRMGSDFPETTVVEGRGRLATRGFACGHHHVYSALSRGMPPTCRATDTFARMLENVWWRLDRCLDRDMIEAGALAAAMHCAKCGVTFIIDHHASPHAIPGSLSVIAAAFERVGLGHLLCYEISGRDGQETAEQGLEETDRYLGLGNKGHVGLHASFTVDDALLKEAVALARKHKTGLHLHVAESREDQDHCMRTYGMRVVQRLSEAGALELPRSIFAHGVHLDESEKELIRRSPVWVAQSVESNLNNNVGLGSYGDLPLVMLGTDGMHGDMIRSMQAVWYTAALAEGAPIALDRPYRRLRAAHAHIQSMGASGDGANNVVLFEYDRPTPLTSENALGHIIYGLASRNVDTVIAQGRIIVDKGRVVSLDEDAVLAFARAQAKRLWSLLRKAG